MSIERYLAGRGRGPDPDPEPWPTWTIERHGTDRLDEPWTRVRRVEGTLASVASEVVNPAPGEFAPGDVVVARSDDLDDPRVAWFVRDDGSLAPLPPPDRVPVTAGSTMRAVDAAGDDWVSLWSRNDASVLLDLAHGAGLPWLALAGACAALLERHLALGDAPALEGPRARMCLVRAALDGPHPAAALRALDPTMARAFSAATYPEGPPVQDVDHALLRLVRVVDTPDQAAPVASDLLLAAGTSLPVRAMAPTDPAGRAEFFATVRQDESANQADVVRAHLPLRAVLDAITERRGRPAG